MACPTGEQAIQGYQPGRMKIAHASSGATTIIDTPQRNNWLKTRSRSSSAVLATMSAPLVENGDASTIEDARHNAMIMATALTSPASRKGTASGTNAPRMPVVDANADTAAPMTQINRAISSGDRR